ncbi:hypothetical protein C4K18_0365 [Pseudomonas chlororaphis subsp. aurantiaca]|nr:hypothetical protein C4K18_0365 [Pseudomonas chlororaphis subsp. aurantiaca]
MSRLFATLNMYRNLEANWDGYGGEPATYESMIDALEFLHSLPVRFPAPIPMLAGDGEISLFGKTMAAIWKHPSQVTRPITIYSMLVMKNLLAMIYH